MIKKCIEGIVAHWRREGIARPAAPHGFVEEHLAGVLPADNPLRELLSRTNGSLADTEGFSFFACDAIVQEDWVDGGTVRQVAVFADYLLGTWVYGIDCASGEVLAQISSDNVRLIARDTGDFLRRYLVDRKAIYVP